MNKRFNITGVCVPNKHYMVDISDKLKKIEKMVNNGDYFIINRPRQFGKTTILSQLSQKLDNEYLIIRTSFEGIGDSIFKDEETFSSNILNLLSKALRFNNPKKSIELAKLNDNLKNLDNVSDSICSFIMNCDRKVILLIDEVDKSSNNQLFLSFLGMLRNKYLLAVENLDYTFHSVILTGVYDVKNLKLKLRPEDEKKYNSPWNIAVNFEVDMNFNPIEIGSMLKIYSDDTGITMDIRKISERLYYYTNGYPFLVSRICQIIHEKLLKESDTTWTDQNVVDAVKLILRENNTLFDDLIKNLEHNPDLYSEVYDIVIKGEIRTFNILNPIINLGVTFGIFKEDDNKVTIHNRIYSQIIYDYLSSKAQSKSDMSAYNFRDNFIIGDNELDFENILLRYQQFMKEQYCDKDAKFIEREGRLLFLAFLKPIINGIGFDFKEVQISQEKRLDVVVTYDKYKYVAELKIWYGEAYHQKGLKQLCDYLDIQGLSKGYLIIYNFNKEKDYKQEKVIVENKEIFIVWI